MASVKPPRSAFINFPLGHPCGKPNDIDLQNRILKDALNVLVTVSTPGEIVALPYEWDVPFNWEDFKNDLAEMFEEEESMVQTWEPEDDPPKSCAI